jgi:hypothetical protein
MCYVALVKGSDVALCHVFRAKSQKASYECTFTCAQAFDYNYRAFLDQASNDLDSSVLEPTIEPRDIGISPVAPPYTPHASSYLGSSTSTHSGGASGAEEGGPGSGGAPPGYVEVSPLFFAEDMFAVGDDMGVGESSHVFGGGALRGRPSPAPSTSTSASGQYLDVEPEQRGSQYLDVAPDRQGLHK